MGPARSWTTTVNASRAAASGTGNGTSASSLGMVTARSGRPTRTGTGSKGGGRSYRASNREPSSRPPGTERMHRRVGRSDPRARRRIGRSHAEHRGEAQGRRGPIRERTVGRPGPLRSARARDGRDHERTGLARRHPAGRWDLLHLQRLHASRRPPCRSERGTCHLLLDPRLGGSRSGRPHSSAGGTAGLAAGHARPAPHPARRRERVPHAWRITVDSEGPTALVLSRQAIPVLEGTADAFDGVRRGGYVPRRCRCHSPRCRPRLLRQRGPPLRGGGPVARRRHLCSLRAHRREGRLAPVVGPVRAPGRLLPQERPPRRSTNPSRGGRCLLRMGPVRRRRRGDRPFRRVSPRCRGPGPTRLHPEPRGRGGSCPRRPDPERDVKSPTNQNRPRRGTPRVLRDEEETP